MAEDEEREIIELHHEVSSSDQGTREISFTGYDPVWQSDYLEVKNWSDDFGRTYLDVPFLKYTVGGYRQIYALTESVAAESTGYQLEGKVGDIVTVAGTVVGDHYSGEIENSVGIYLILGNGNTGAPTGTDFEPRIGAGAVALDHIVVDSSTPSTFAGADFEFTTTIESIDVDNNNLYLLITQLEQDGTTRFNGFTKLSVTVDRLVVEEGGGDELESLPHHEALANIVARNIDEAGNESVIELAKLHVELVEGFVHGYTRGNGFDEEGVPERPLRNVIVMAASKLTYNPEQVSWFRSGEYSERPAQWLGWSLMDLSILNRYRKRWA